MVLTREDLELLKRLQAAGERGRTIPEFNTRITLQRLARGGYVIARAGLELVNYRITQRGKDAIEVVLLCWTDGGLAKVDSGFDYAANFSSFACVA